MLFCGLGKIKCEYTLSKNWAISDTHVNKIAPCSHQWLTTSHQITVLPLDNVAKGAGQAAQQAFTFFFFHYSYEDILTLRLLPRHAHEV